MHSYEDGIRAELLNIQLGKCTGATIRQLGYPTKNALKCRYQAYLHGNDLPVGYVRAKPKCSPEQKAVAVAHYLQQRPVLPPPCERWAIPDTGRSLPGLMSCTRSRRNGLLVPEGM